MSSRSLENTIREIMRGPITEQVMVESHFKVGDEVIYKGQEGEVVKLDTPQTGKYYHVELEDGKVIKASSDELKLEDEDEEDEEDEEEDDDEEEKMNEKAVSQAQQKAAGIALAAKRGDIPKSQLQPSSKAMMGMSTKELEKFAKTKHKGLPTRKEETELEEKQMYYSIVHKPTNKVLSTHKSLESAKDEHRGMDQGVRAHYYIATSTKEPKTFNMKEDINLDEAVSVKKQNYSWGKMMTVHHGNETSYPLHPEHQAKIKALGDGEKTSFKDETKRTVIAHRDGDTIHLSGSGTSKKTPVKRSHFTEAVDKGEYDFEGDMAKTQLNTMMDAAKELRGMLKDDENMPEWVQSKITKAADYLDSARDYMKNRNMKPTEDQNEAVAGYKGQNTNRPKGKDEPREVRGAERKDKEFVVKFENPSGGGVKLRSYMAKSPLDADSKARVDAKRMNMRVASVRLKEDIDLEESVGSVVGGAIGQFIGNKIDPLHGEIMRTLGAPAGRAAEYTIRKHLHNLHQALKKHLSSGTAKEEVELDEGKYGAFRLGPGVGRFSSRGRAPHQGLTDPRTGLPLGFSPIKKDEPKEKPKNEDVELDEVSADVAKRVAQARDRSAVANKLTSTQLRRLKMGIKGGDPDMNAADTLKKAMKRGAKNVYGEANEKPPFEGPYKKTPADTTDKSGAKHTPMSRTRHLARSAIQQMMKKKNMKETKAAPPGFHFTRDGRLKRGDADQDGPGGSKLRADPLDKQRSKIPPVSD